MTDSNGRPADQLANVRAKIKVLKAEEAEIRQGLVDGTLDPEGDEYSVSIEKKINERLNLRQMRETIDSSIWSPYLISKETVYVSVRKRAG